MTVAPAGCLRTGKRWLLPMDRTERKDGQGAGTASGLQVKPPPAVARSVPGPQKWVPQAEVHLAPLGFEPPSLGAPGDTSLPPSSGGTHSACLSVCFPQGCQSPSVRAPP